MQVKKRNLQAVYVSMCFAPNTVYAMLDVVNDNTKSQNTLKINWSVVNDCCDSKKVANLQLFYALNIETCFG